MPNRGKKKKERKRDDCLDISVQLISFFSIPIFFLLPPRERERNCFFPFSTFSGIEEKGITDRVRRNKNEKPC